MPKDPRCNEQISIDDGMPPPFGGASSWRCVLPKGHDGSCVTEWELRSTPRDAPDPRCAQVLPPPSPFAGALRGPNRCVMWAGHPGHHLFQSEVASPGVLNIPTDTPTVLHGSDESLGRINYVFAQPVTLSESDIMRRLFDAALDWPDTDDEATSLAGPTVAHLHVGSESFYVTVSLDGSPVSDSSTPEPSLEDALSKLGDEPGRITIPGADGRLLTVSRRETPPHHAFMHEVSAVSLTDAVGRRYRFDPPVETQTGDTITATITDGSLMVTVHHADGTVTAHLGTTPEEAVNDARPTMAEMRAEMGLAPIPVVTPPPSAVFDMPYSAHVLGGSPQHAPCDMRIDRAVDGQRKWLFDPPVSVTAGQTYAIGVDGKIACMVVKDSDGIHHTNFSSLSWPPPVPPETRYDQSPEF